MMVLKIVLQLYVSWISVSWSGSNGGSCGSSSSSSRTIRCADADEIGVLGPVDGIMLL